LEHVREYLRCLARETIPWPLMAVGTAGLVFASGSGQA